MSSHEPEAIDLLDYDQRADQWNREYQEEYRKWVASLSPAQRAKLKRADLGRPLSSSDRVGGRSPDEDRDPADSYIASYDPDIAGSIDRPEEILAEEYSLTMAQSKAIAKFIARREKEISQRRDAWLLQRIVGVLISSSNVKVSAAGLAFACQLNVLNGMGTLREWAACNGVSPASVSKSQILWRETLALPTSPHGKSEAARAALSKAQKEKHWRKRHAHNKAQEQTRQENPVQTQEQTPGQAPDLFKATESEKGDRAGVGAG